MNKLVSVKNETVFISTKILSEKLDRQHRNIVKLVRTYKKELEMLGGVMRFEILPKKDNIGGGASKVYYLNEEQYIFLITNMRTKANEIDTVMKAKMEISKQFVQMRKWILEQKTQKANQEYIETRNKSKLGRKQETDIIKTFIEYAINQGSKSANKYYMAISKMENQAFFILKEKFKNVREILNITQLSKIIIADMIVRQALIDGMDREMFYKDIFQLAKKRVVDLANSLGVKEVIPNLEIKQMK